MSWGKGQKMKFVEEMKKVRGSPELNFHSLKMRQQNLFPEEKDSVPSLLLLPQLHGSSSKNLDFLLNLLPVPPL